MVYFVLGTPGSGRRELLRFLIQQGLEEEQMPVAVLRAAADADPARDGELAGLRSVSLADLDPGAPAIPAAARTVFVIADGTANPIDQIEALKAWLDGAPRFELARIFTVIDARLASTVSKAREYYAACAFFSDVLFLGRREDVSKKWIHEYQEHFRKECYPCLFELLKKDGRVADPLQVLFPEARRLSQFFDPQDEDEVSPLAFFAGDEEDLPEITGFDDDVDEGAVDDDPVAPELYLERDESGRRRRPVPAPRDFLRV